MYEPAAVPEFTLTLPVTGSNTRPAGTVEPEAKLRIEFAVVAGAPLIWSPVKAFTTLLAPVAPLMPETVSAVATMGDGSTTTVTVLLAQLAGLSISQIL